MSSNSMLDMALDMQKTAQAEMFNQWKRFLNAPKLHRVARDVGVATTPHDVVYEQGTLKLIRYKSDTEIKYKEPILVCFSLVNRPYILDLQPERSVVRQLLKGGFDVYMIDWGIPTAADRTLRLHDYICGFMKNVVDYVTEHSDVSKLNLLGYCMGGTMSAMYTSLYQSQILNLILMAAPIDFEKDDGLLKIWTSEEYFDVDQLIDVYGNCPGSFLQGCFQMMKPVQNYYEKYVGFNERMHDDNFLENFFAMERWGNDNIPVAGETFREFVKMLYQKNQMVKGEMKLKDVKIDLKKIKCPVLMLTADKDHLVRPDTTLSIKDFIRSKDIETMSINAGHIGLAVSSKAHRQLWPDAAKWIGDHSTALAE